jgi:hypothetical protein
VTMVSATMRRSREKGNTNICSKKRGIEKILTVGKGGVAWGSAGERLPWQDGSLVHRVFFLK